MSEPKKKTFKFTTVKYMGGGTTISTTVEIEADTQEEANKIYAEGTKKKN